MLTIIIGAVSFVIFMALMFTALIRAIKGVQHAIPLLVLAGVFFAIFFGSLKKANPEALGFHQPVVEVSVAVTPASVPLGNDVTVAFTVQNLVDRPIQNPLILLNNLELMKAVQWQPPAGVRLAPDGDGFFLPPIGPSERRTVEIRGRAVRPGDYFARAMMFDKGVLLIQATTLKGTPEAPLKVVVVP